MVRDESLSLLAEGYDFLPRRGWKAGRRWFRTRLMSRPAIGLSGGDAPEVLYAPGRFTRVGALPPTTLRLLQDVDSVNQLDGAAHRKRKAAFLDLLSEAQARRLADAFEPRLRARLSRGGRFALLPTAARLLCAAALDWMGVPQVTRRDLMRRTRDCSAMVGRAGAADLSVLGSLLLRERTERWARRLIAAVRFGALRPAPDSPLARVAAWTDEAGRVLPVRTAAVELINLLRPIVAAARYIVFAADALRRQPDWRARLRTDDEASTEAFAQEVRRAYPFFPAVAGRVVEPFQWSGRRFRRGEWVLADLHGANQDPARWTDPERFDPGRFLAAPGMAAPGMADRVVAQGAGDPRLSHRCPGERMTIELIKAATRLLAHAEWTTPPQRFDMPLDRLPTAPRDGFVMELETKSAGRSSLDADLPARAGAGVFAALFAGLGLSILAAPRTGASVFGLPAGGQALPFVRALAFRDLGLAAIFALAAKNPRHGQVGAVALGASVIPCLDAVLVARRRGHRALPALALHALSGAALLAVAMRDRSRA